MNTDPRFIINNNSSMNQISTPNQTIPESPQPSTQPPLQPQNTQSSPQSATSIISPPPADQPPETSFNRFLPLKFGKLLTISPLSWSSFKGKIDNTLPWSAHIFWNIQYKLSNDLKPKLSVSVVVSPKSWVRKEKKCEHLLNHQQGHLLIGYLCAIEFVRHIHQSKISPLYMEYVNGVFGRVLKEYRKIERKYDEETDHRMNYVKQEEWDRWIKKRLMECKAGFCDKKGKFIIQN